MENLKLNLKKYLQAARAATAMNDFDGAREYLVHAAECTLMLAKESNGVARNKYLSDYANLKSMLESLVAKQRGAVSASSSAPIPEQRPPYAEASKPAGVSPTPTKLVIPPKPQTPARPQAPVYPQEASEQPQAPARPQAPTPQPQASAASAQESAQKTQSASVQSKYGAQDHVTPRTLDDYIGQPDAVTAVRDLIDAARVKMAPLPHLIIYGSNGLGKTTFAKIIANELGVGFTELNVTKATPEDMVSFLQKLEPRDILFIDEIHTIPLVVAESILYSAMQDGRITYTEGKGKNAKTVTMDIPPFTLIGATTEIGKLAKPFTHRAITVRLQEYTDEVLGGIVKSSLGKLGYGISDALALSVSRRCRNNPRTANNNVKRIADKALMRHVREHNLFNQGPFTTPESIRKLEIQISEEVIEEFFKESGIDAYGLESGDRELLEIIIHRYKGGPVGLDNLARSMNESNNVISQKYEAYLIKKGLIRVDRDGRVAMPEAYRVLGLPVPDGIAERFNEERRPEEKSSSFAAESASVGANEKKSRFDSIKVAALPFPDELKCQKIEDLITYPENAGAVSDSLDDLFGDVEKPEVEIKSTYELSVEFKDFSRTMICDSKLESRFAMALVGTGYVLDIKAQTLEIPYISQELASRRYFPDFVIKDYKGRIAVIEMKNYDMVSYHLNIDKYEHLRRYCEANGYGYSEVLKPYDSDNYVSMEMLKNEKINEALHQHILQTIENKAASAEEPMFTERDFEAYCKEFGRVDRSAVYTILLNDRHIKNVDRVGKNFMIQKN
jgi:Holliday junction DNA helicase RuvB